MLCIATRRIINLETIQTESSLQVNIGNCDRQKSRSGTVTDELESSDEDLPSYEELYEDEDSEELSE